MESTPLPALGVGDQIEVTIERIVPGGLGLTHAAGRTIFVGLTAPGDRARVRLDRVQGSIGFASIVELIEASADRMAPPCPVFGRCGGCDFQHLAYAAQLAAKRGIVEDALRRIGGIQLGTEIELIASPQPWGYRAVAEWQVDPDSGALGYFARESREVIDVPSCPILVPALDAALYAARDRRRSARSDRPVELRAAAGDQSSEVIRVGTKPTKELSRVVAGEHYRFDAGCFFQANPSIVEAVVREVVRPVQPTGDEIAVDLYCGVGLFTLPLGRRFRRVIGVEADNHTAEYARRNLLDAALDAVLIEVQPVERWLAGARKRLGQVAFLVLDPPRVGAKEAIPNIVRLAPARIAYVSCDPATLARDLRPLLAAGYELETVTAFDMFPQTHHLEMVAQLVRSAPSGR